MPNNITEKVNSILMQRHARVSTVEQKLKELESVKDALHRFDTIRSTMLSEDGSTVAGSPYSGFLDENPEIKMALNGIAAKDMEEKIGKLEDSYNDLKDRFSREYINIAVVGPARQGKSRFLQSISGLNNKCIPAFTGGHCTGASSTIENGDNDKVLVKLKFKTEKEMRDEINGYLSTITKGNKMVSTVREIRNISPEMLTEWMNKYIDEKDNIIAAEAKKLVAERYIKNYSEWIDLIGREETTLYDEDEIMTYVSQHNGKSEYKEDGRENPDFEKYYKFVAVKSARIIKKFEYEDCGKIKIIDTVGLGSIENDTQSNMMKVIKKDSDGVIFFKRPENSTTGTNDSSDRQIYNDIKREFNGRDMGKWFTYVINHTSAESPFGDNFKTCQIVKKSIEGEEFPLLSIDILDVSDTEKVKEEFLVKYLTSLSNNICEIDNVILNEVNELAQKVYDEYTSLCRKIEKAVAGKVKNSLEWKPLFEKKFKEVYSKGITINLREYTKELREKKNSECKKFMERCNDIIDKIFESVPKKEEIQKIFDSIGDVQASSICIYLMNDIRNKIAKKFIDIDTELSQMTAEFKNRIVHILADSEDGCGRLGRLVEINHDKPEYEWLSDFEEYIKGSEYNEIETGLHNLINFEVSVKGFLIHKVRIILDCINPCIPEAGNFKLTSSDVSQDIFGTLIDRVEIIKDNLNEELYKFWKTPNEAFYAAADEFYDRVTFAGIDEDSVESVRMHWSNLYFENSEKIWPDEYNSIAGRKVALGELNDAVKVLTEKAKKSNFII